MVLRSGYGFGNESSLQMIEVTTIGSHAVSPVLGEVCHRLVDAFLWQLFPEGLQSDFQLISFLGFRLWS